VGNSKNLFHSLFRDSKPKDEL